MSIARGLDLLPEASLPSLGPQQHLRESLLADACWWRLAIECEHHPIPGLAATQSNTDAGLRDLWRLDNPTNIYLVTLLLFAVHKLGDALIIPLHNLELKLGCAKFMRHLGLEMSNVVSPTLAEHKTKLKQTLSPPVPYLRALGLSDPK